MIKSTIFIIAFLFLGTDFAKAQHDPGEPPLGYAPRLIQSLFTEDHRNRDFDNALTWGRWLVMAHPKEMEDYPGTYRGDRNFRRMIEIYEHKANETNDPSLRSAYLDSVQIMYEMVFDHFEEDEIDYFQWLQRRGRFFQQYASFINDGFRHAYQDYMSMFEIDPKRATETADGYFVQITVDNFQRTNRPDEALWMIEQAEPYAGPELLSFFDEARNELFSDPDERIAWLESQREENPDDLELIEQLMGLYKIVNDNDKAQQYAMLLYEKNPTYDNIMRLADDAISNAEYETAIRYLRESIEKTDDSRKKRAAALQISDNYLSLRQLEEARQYALRALNYDANWGQPYLKIAEIYGQAVRQCAGSELDRRDKVVYWLVLDYLDKARNTDQSTARQVNRLYSTYQAVTPTAEEMHFAQWSPGNKLRVDRNLRDCYAWINEETTIRSR